MRGSFPLVLVKLFRSGHVLPIAIIGFVVGAICVVIALAIDWLPDPASKEADRVDLLIWWTVWASIGIFTIVATFLIYSVWKFRVGDDDDEDGPPTHGNTLLEIIWTAIPTVMLGVTAAWASVVLVQNEEIATANGGPMYVDVLAQQFAWEFTYPDLGVTTGDLRVPVDRQIILRLRAKDVIHDFFVYETRIKGDAVPGNVNDRVRFTMKPEYAGRKFDVICAELCGAGHSVMRTQMFALTKSDYEAWASKAKADAAAEGQG